MPQHYFTDLAALRRSDIVDVVTHEHQAETIPTADLATADAAWLVSSVRLAAPITAIDGVEIPLDAELTASVNAYLLSVRD